MAQIELVGADILTAKLLSLPNKIRQKIEKEAIREANQLLAGTLRQNIAATAVETGALEKSIKHDVRTHKGGNEIVGRVGADRDYVKVHKGKRRRPAKYIHLVNLGTKQRKTKAGHNRGKTQGMFFREKTAEQHKATIQKLFEKAVNEALN